MRNVMIATPVDDEKINVYFSDALTRVLRELRARNLDVDVFPVYLPNTAPRARARNWLCKRAMDAFGGDGMDDVVWIDADMVWQPADFFRLLSHDVDMVGGLYVQRKDPPVLVYRPKKGAVPDERGLMEVETIGAGFLRMRGKVLEKLWKASRKTTEGREVFEYSFTKSGEPISEDFQLCYKWAAMRGKVFADTRVACGHMGTKVFRPVMKSGG